MKWFHAHLPLAAAAVTLVMWVYSTFAQSVWVREYVDVRHEQVMKSLDRIEAKLWKLHEQQQQ